jgi:hypothetical protein
VKAPGAVDGTNGRKPPKVAAILHEERLVKAVGGTNGGKRLLVLDLTEHHAGGIASDGVKEKKHQGCDTPEHEKGSARAPHSAAGKSLKW